MRKLAGERRRGGRRGRSKGDILLPALG